MEATNRPWMILCHNSPYMEGTIVAVGETEVAGVWNEADAEFMVRAVNTFDQAREALKDACLTYAVHGDQPPQKWLDALAAMEATSCQPDK